MSIVRWILKLYPAGFRARFADGMQAALTEDYARARGRGRIAAARFLVSAIAHAVWFGLAERLPRMATIRSFLSTDLRDAMRALKATPVVTTVAVLSLALGIGANTALFSILNGLVLRQLPAGR